jgi:thymidylate synthase
MTKRLLSFFRKRSGSSSEEYQYTNLIKKCIKTGEVSDDRTGVGTYSLFGEKIEFDISKSIPVITTRRTAFKTCIKELLWMLSGSTDATIIQKQKCHIWDGNTSREFLDKRGLNHLPEGDIGALYGFQLRHFGAEYKTCKDDYTNQGVDQLSYVINEIKNNPTSRRILFNYWNPLDLDKGVLNPCHTLFQFNVSGKNNEYLSGCLFQR